MILKKYEALPENMKNNEVKEYYEILKHKKFSLIIKIDNFISNNVNISNNDKIRIKRTSVL